MLWGTNPIPVLLIPAERMRPLQERDMAPTKFAELLGGTPQSLRPLITGAEPVDWQLFVCAESGNGRRAQNWRAQTLVARLGGQPLRNLYGDVIFAGWAVADIVQPVPGMVTQMARLLGMTVREQF